MMKSFEHPVSMLRAEILSTGGISIKRVSQAIDWVALGNETADYINSNNLSAGIDRRK